MLLRMAVVQKPFQFFVTWHSSAHLSDNTVGAGLVQSCGSLKGDAVAS